MNLTSAELSGNPRQALARQIGAAAARSTVWLDSPFNLYLVDRQAEMYLNLMRSASYGKGFHATIRRLIEENCDALLSGLPGAVDLVDLGPGFPDKTFALLRGMRMQAREGRYIPVDISRRFLQLAADACRGFGFPVDAKHLLFEELPGRLAGDESAAARLVVMGVTFMNYTPERGCALLASLLRPGDAGIISVELLRDEALESTMNPYRTEQARAFNSLPLEIAGIPSEVLDYFVEFERNRIEMGFRIGAPVEVAGVRLHSGQRIVTSFSYRLRLDQLEQELRAVFSRADVYCDPAKTCAVVRVHR